MRRLFPFVFAVGLTLGCSAASEEEVQVGEEQELTASNLRQISNIQKRVTAEGAADLAYRPSQYPGSSIPFEGVEVALESSDSGSEVDVQVVGEFPGSALVLVVDRDYRIVARGYTQKEETWGIRTQTERLSAIGRADLRVRMPQDARILVRDRRWDRQMNFQIVVGR